MVAGVCPAGVSMRSVAPGAACWVRMVARMAMASESMGERVEDVTAPIGLVVSSGRKM